MKPIITKFHPKTGDIEITIPVPYTDPWEEHINYPMPAYEKREFYNIFALIKENQELKETIGKISKIVHEIKKLTETTNGYPSDYIDNLLEILKEVE